MRAAMAVETLPVPPRRRMVDLRDIFGNETLWSSNLSRVPRRPVSV
jgi:hypothetical protein